MAETPPTVTLWNSVQNAALFHGFALSIVLAFLCYVPVRRTGSIRRALANNALPTASQVSAPILIAWAVGLVLAGVISSLASAFIGTGRLAVVRPAVAPGGFERFSINPQGQSLHGYATVRSASFILSAYPTVAWGVGAPDLSWGDLISVPRTNPDMTKPMRKLRGFILVPLSAQAGVVSGDLHLEVRYPSVSGRGFSESVINVKVAHEFEVSAPSLARRVLAHVAELGLGGLFIFPLLAGLLAVSAVWQLDMVRPRRRPGR